MLASEAPAKARSSTGKSEVEVNNGRSGRGPEDGDRDDLVSEASTAFPDPVRRKPNLPSHLYHEIIVSTILDVEKHTWGKYRSDIEVLGFADFYAEQFMERKQCLKDFTREEFLELLAYHKVPEYDRVVSKLDVHHVFRISYEAPDNYQLSLE